MTSLVLCSGPSETKVLMPLPPVPMKSSFAPLGRRYFQQLRTLSGKEEEEGLSPKASSTTPTEQDIVIPTDVTYKTLDNYSYYDLLGLSKYVDASDEVIHSKLTKAFHAAVKIYHPDKQIDIEEEHARAIYLRIQHASVTLGDPLKRRQYDSLMPFDESVPSETATKAASKEGAAAFCTLYAPVFKRNARFSEKKPVPDMGDENTPYTDVANFYSFWVNFDSWRDFSNACEHDLDNAGSREEKREWQRENARQAKKMKKAEVGRISDFVMRAQNYDPRVIAVRDAKKNQKAAEKREAEELAEKRRVAEIEAEKAEAERKAKEEEKRKADKVLNDKLKKSASKFRNTFRKILKLLLDKGVGDKCYGVLSDEECELICKVSEPAGLNELNESLGGEACLKDNSLLKVDVAAELVLSYLEKMYILKEEKKKFELREADIKRREAKVSTMLSDLKRKGISRVWTEEEYGALIKAIQDQKNSRQKWKDVAKQCNDALTPAIPFSVNDVSKASSASKDITAYLSEKKQLDAISQEDLAQY